MPRKKTVPAETTDNRPESEAPERSYPTPQEMSALIEDYFTECEEARPRVFPDEAGMMLKIGLLKRDIDYLTDETRCPEATLYSDVLEFATLRRKSLLMRKMVTDRNAANGCMNALKQIENGGLTDKPLENKDKKLIVKVAESDDELFM